MEGGYRWGKLTDDDIAAIDGRYDQFVGKMQERYGYNKEQAEREWNDWSRRSDPMAQR